MSPSPFEARLRRLRDRLHDARLDGLLVSHPPNVRYLCGFTGSSGYLLIEPGSATLMTDFRYETQATDETGAELAVFIVRNGLVDSLAERLAESGTARHIGYEDHELTVRDRHAIGEACGGVVWEPAGGIVEGLRARKDAEEIACIARAAGMADAALADTLPAVREGVTERELAAELDYRLALHGSGPPAFQTIVAAGPRSALPHGRPGDSRLRVGDLVLFDFGATVDGYCSDMTRVFVIGQAAAWQRELHAAVDRALLEALESVVPGVAARDVDAAARKILDMAGYGDRFGHGTGHGVGLEVHEGPRLNQRSRDTLEVGHVVTIEPGVYLPGQGGVRLEETVAVEEDGGRVLSGYPRALGEL